MSTTILATKLYIPPLRDKFIHRSGLVARLNEGLAQKLTLVSASAGFGKTTLLGEWLAGCKYRAAWLSLDECDNEPSRFFSYFIEALRTVFPSIGEGALNVLQSSQTPPLKTILTHLLNEIASLSDDFLCVLDDYHLIESTPVNDALTFLIDHSPPHMHLVIATREDPQLPLARWRARGQLTELRAQDLRFDILESTSFLRQAMGLSLSTEEIAALVSRTEGWIAGLQLAALSMRGHPDTALFIDSFTGSNRFVLDYLLEEVLRRQTEKIQKFLLRTSILDRMCSSLCNAVLEGEEAHDTLAFLERANLFIVPLDDERHWYRYHHLMADLLRQRLGQGNDCSCLHTRASQWYENNGFAPEAFHHAVAANDTARAERLAESKGMPLHERGVVITILKWLDSLSKSALDSRPSLWAKKATLSLIIGQTEGVEENLLASELALKNFESGEWRRNLIGIIASARATLALTQYRIDTVIEQSQRALEFLDQGNIPFRTTATWTMGFAYEQLGKRSAARDAYSEVIALSQASGNVFFTILATQGLAQIMEMENMLPSAANEYKRTLELFGDHPLPNAAESHLGLARILYEWNDLDAAEKHGQLALNLSKLYDSSIDRFILCEIFLSKAKRARGDSSGAASLLAEAAQSVIQMKFAHRAGELAAVQVETLLRQGDILNASQLAEKTGGQLSKARVYLAQKDYAAALTILEPLLEHYKSKGYQDELLKVMVLQSLALHAQGEKTQAIQCLHEALALAERGGIIRSFVDEGMPMVALLTEASRTGIKKEYIAKLLAACAAEGQRQANEIPPLPTGSVKPYLDPLSEREKDVLLLIAEGLSNQEISERLFLALSTVKGHNQKIFDKLQVQNRTEAVARAREFGLL